MKKTYSFIVLVIVVILGIGWRVHTSDAHKNSVTFSTQLNAKKASANTFNKKKYSIDDPSSIWVVINKLRTLNPINYAPGDLVSVGNGQIMRKVAAVALIQMFNDADSQGIKLLADSGYRSYADQVSIYNSEVRNNGEAVANTESAVPGHSEHQTGFAVDVGGGGCNIDDCFANTKEGQWVASHSYEYGYIVRYTTSKQAVTGYRAEPWHIRYIGTELSQEMHKENVSTLEEFFGL